MKIAVTSQGPDLESAVDQRFGRCPYVVIVETEDMSFEAVANPFAEESGGVGPRLAALLSERGVQAVLLEDCGPHATEALETAGIRMVGLCADTVGKAVEAFKNDQTDSGKPQESQSWPTSIGRGERMGRGQGGTGRGRGGGRGMGMGRGGGHRRQRRNG